MLVFAIGAAVGAGGWAVCIPSPTSESNAAAGAGALIGKPLGGCRSVSQLIGLSGEELAKVDIVEMDFAVARGIAGLETLDYARYPKIIDIWAARFAAWLPTVEPSFHATPEKWKNDIAFFRLGALARWLDETVGIACIDEQKHAREVRYTDPGDLFLFGLLDTKRGTRASMPTLHVAIGRRLGWPVHLAAVKHHFVCRYDDGRAVYNIETTDTGRGGFAAGSDEEYVRKFRIPPIAVACGSDLRSLSARETLGVFVARRGRHLADCKKFDLADRSFSLARWLYPMGRASYKFAFEAIIHHGRQLFRRDEKSYPDHLMALFSPDPGPAPGPARAPLRGRHPMAELHRIRAANAAVRRQMDQSIGPVRTQKQRPGPGR